MLTIVYPNCAGLDVHKTFVVACRLQVDGQGQTHKVNRKFSSMTHDLQALSLWLAAAGCTHVAIPQGDRFAVESTGVYWQPVYHSLEGQFELFLVNAQSVKRMPGRKTEMQDAEWLATLMQHGLLTRSFIPTREQRELRDLARYRLSQVEERDRIANRLQKVLEDTNLKLASVVSDFPGVSAQAILRALVAGETDPQALSELSKGGLRSKRQLMAQALVGEVSAHHRFLLSDLLAHLDFLDEQIASVEAHLDARLAQLPTYQLALEWLDTIPGINRQLAIALVAEIGVDMSRFPSDRHVTAWAGMAPGNNETGGRQRASGARQGNKDVRRSVALAARTAVRTKHCYLRALYHRLAARRGKNRAAVAVGRTILQMSFHMLQRHQTYQELGDNYLDQLDRERTSRRLQRGSRPSALRLHLRRAAWHQSMALLLKSRTPHCPWPPESDHTFSRQYQSSVRLRKWHRPGHQPAAARCPRKSNLPLQKCCPEKIGTFDPDILPSRF